MKKLSRIIAIAITMCVLLSGCTGQAEVVHNGIVVTRALEGREVLVGNIPIEFPLTEQAESLNILVTGFEDYEQEGVFVWDKYEQMTGVNINWTTVTKAQRGEEVHSALTNGRSLDMILRCKISANRLIQYGSSGLILDLAKDGMLEKYAPNCWAYLQSHPDTLASVTNPDGTIYALPQVNSGAELRVSRKIFINKQWLAASGLEVPETTEELYNLLTAFKQNDMNGNGDTDDEIPLSTMDWLSVQEAFFGAFGLGNRGLHNQRVDCDEATGKVRLICGTESYRDYLEYFNRLFTEGLLDSNIFTMTNDEWYNNIDNDRVGVFVSTNLASLPADKTDNWVAVETALEGPNGDKLWTAVRANFHSTGAALLPATCKNPELCLRWLDYFWTDEGTLFYHMGIEGETFTVNEDGTFSYAQKIYDEMANGNLSFDEAVAAYSPYPGGSNPTVEIAPYFMGGEAAPVPAAAARSLFEYGPKEYWPCFTFTEQENGTLDAVRADLDKYCDASCIEFVTGTRPLTQWDEYKSQLEKLNASELVAIYQAALDRYNALSQTLD